MKEWILQHTEVTEEQYDTLINPITVTFKGISKDITKEPLTDHPIININYFTFEPPTEERIKEFNIQKEKDYYLYQNIKFKFLAELLPSLNLDLYSQTRLGTCFNISIKICFMRPKSRIVTALCTDIYHQSHETFLHTFVIITSLDDNQEYVLDGTMNTIIKKQEYFDLFQAQIISDIPKNEFLRTSNLFSRLHINDEITLIEYLCFPKATTKAAKKIARIKEQ